MHQAHAAAQQAHLGQLLDATGGAAPPRLPPHHLSSGPRHHSMPDRRVHDDSANGLMHAAHDLMFGHDSPQRPRLPAMRSITLPSDVCNGRVDAPAPGPPMPNPRHFPTYPSATPGPPHHAMHHHMQRPYHPPSGHHWQPDFSVVRSAAPTATLSTSHYVLPHGQSMCP